MGNKNDEQKISIAANVIDILESVIVAIVISIFILTLICRTGYVSGDSMLTTMYDSDRYIVSNLFYTPKYGDIIVFQPENETDGETLYVKRIVATGGQTVDISADENGEYNVYVNGKKLTETYIDSYQTTYPAVYPAATESASLHVEVPEGYVFVMGDNRLESKDSRIIGCIDNRRIVGRILIRFYPFNKFGMVK